MGEGLDVQVLLDERRTVGEICESCNEFGDVGGDDVVLSLDVSFFCCNISTELEANCLGTETDLFAKTRKRFFSLAGYS